MATEPHTEPPDRWWRYGIMWLVIGGPAAVVVASLATGFIALQGADPIIATPAAGVGAYVPALQGRNHAATPKR